MAPTAPAWSGSQGQKLAEHAWCSPFVVLAAKGFVMAPIMRQAAESKSAVWR
jgi:hypothetical protein